MTDIRVAAEQARVALASICAPIGSQEASRVACALLALEAALAALPGDKGRGENEPPFDQFDKLVAEVHMAATPAVEGSQIAGRDGASDAPSDEGSAFQSWPPGSSMLQVAVAPHAAAGPYPTAMRPATPEEHEWLTKAARRAGRLVPHPDTQDAERYRWLRGEHDPADLPIAQVVWKRNCEPRGEWVNLIDGNDLDRHIDAARQVAHSSQAQGELSVNARRAPTDGAQPHEQGEQS